MDINDDSDLTDVESGDDNAYTQSQAEAKKKKVPPVYAIRKTLKAPRATTYSTLALYEAIHNEDINLDADYQRDVVWQDTKQIGLIDSIYRNFYVPPIIFATKTYEDGTENKICIDGKQRLTSIRRFMDGLIPHKDPETSEKWWYKDLPQSSNRGRKILPEKLRRMFANKQIVCVEYQDITENDEREIFQRVQLGMALTPAEKLQVINTPRSSFVRELMFTHITEGGLSPRHLEWDCSRGADFRCTASAVWCMSKWTDGTLKTAPTINQLERWLSGTDELDDDFLSKCQETFQIFEQIVSDKKLGKVFRTHYGGADSSKEKTKIAPLEFVLIPLIIMVNKDRLTLQQVSTTIGKMREDVRKQHVDIRLNNKVAKTMVDFVRAFKPSKLPPDSGPTATAARKVKAPVENKRKRPVDSESSELSAESGSDSDYGAKKQTAKKKQKAAAPIPKKVEPPSPALTSATRPPVTTQEPLPAPSSSRMAALRARMASSTSTTQQYHQHSVTSSSAPWSHRYGPSSSIQATHLPTPPSPGSSTPRTHSIQQSHLQSGSLPVPPTSASSSSSYFPPAAGGFSAPYSDLRSGGPLPPLTYGGSGANATGIGGSGGGGGNRASYSSRGSGDNGYGGGSYAGYR